MGVGVGVEVGVGDGVVATEVEEPPLHLMLSTRLVSLLTPLSRAVTVQI